VSRAGYIDRAMRGDFQDIRGHGFVRVAVCVPEMRVADPEFNVEAHLRVLERVQREGAQYALCPELGLSAYSCADLFFQETLLDGAVTALGRLAAATARWNLIVSVGMPLVVDDLLFNCAVTLFGGRPVAVAPKAYPPNYREFYELRWFHPAAEARSAEVTLLGARVPFGTDVLVRAPHLPGFVLHTDVCEDLWTPVPPGTIAALSGATVLANLSASNVTVGKWEYRKQLVSSSSAKNLVVQLYSAAGFGESTADLAWDGHGLIAERGELVAETERFTLGGDVALVDVDLDSLVQDRLRQGSWGQNAAAYGRPLRAVDLDAVEETRDAALFRRFRRHIEPQPFVPADPHLRDIRCREIFLIKTTSLARRLRSLPEDKRRVVIGISGGQDSTEALLVAVHAMDLLGLPRAHAIGVTMPGFGTSKRTYENACTLVRALGATLEEIDITAIAGQVFGAIGHDPRREDVTFENVQAWARKFVLFSLASEKGAIDLGTGDLTELALGWATYGGDHMSHYGINAGVPKTLISYLIRWAAETVFRDEPQVARVLESILETPISPELLRLDAEGEISQKSEEIVGPYELHDFFLYWFLRFGFGPRRIARMAQHAFENRYDLTTIRRWLLVFLRRFFQSQFKRDCLPDAPKVGSGGSLSPRGDWRMPSDASVEAWIAEAESIPTAETATAPRREGGTPLAAPLRRRRSARR
jgi:NAD+ synthase (glutamine-hydrolysing)